MAYSNLTRRKPVKLEGVVIQNADLPFVQVGFEGEAASYRRIERSKFTPEALKLTFGVNVFFLSNDNGDVFWPRDWPDQLYPPPFKYHINLKETADMEPDFSEDPYYRGETLLAAYNVPKETPYEALYAWIQRGLDDEDAVLQRAIQDQKEARADYTKVVARIEELPYAEIPARNEEERQRIRQNMSKDLHEEKERLEQELMDLESTLKQERARRTREVFTMSKSLPPDDPPAKELESPIWRAEPDASEAEAKEEAARQVKVRQRVKELVAEKKVHQGVTWLLHLPPNMQHAANVLVRKDNWNDYRVAYHPRKKRAIAVMGDEQMPENFVKYELNLRDVRISRRRHGTGAYLFKSGRMYIGDWFEGAQDGGGVEVDRRSVYKGGFAAGLRMGRGTIQYANGDVYQGDVAYDQSHIVGSLIYVDQYNQGGPFRIGTYTFGDGAVYEGQWRCGRPNGSGRYTAADGTVQVGTFENGALTGNGTILFPDGSVQSGTFKNGVLQGTGTMKVEGVWEYRGDLDLGEPHGRGVQTFANGDRYQGYMHAGCRSGHGVLQFGHVKRHFNHVTLKTSFSADLEAHATWRAGLVRARNMIENPTSMHHFFTTNNMAHTRYPRLAKLQEETEEQLSRLASLRRDAADDAAHKRASIERAKLNEYERERSRAEDAMTYNAQFDVGDVHDG